MRQPKTEAKIWENSVKIRKKQGIKMSKQKAAKNLGYAFYL